MSEKAKITGNEPIGIDATPNGSMGGLYGLTIRQHFAGIAMQGILSNTNYTKYVESNIWKPAHGEIGKLAVEMADELIAELNK